MKVLLLSLLLLFQNFGPGMTSTVSLSWSYDYTKPGNTADHFLYGIVCTPDYLKNSQNGLNFPDCTKASDGNSYWFLGKVTSPSPPPDGTLNFMVSLLLKPPFMKMTFFVAGCNPTDSAGNETCGIPTTVTQQIHANQIGTFKFPISPPGGLNTSQGGNSIMTVRRKR